jgi:hypothetical protein
MAGVGSGAKRLAGAEGGEWIAGIGRTEREFEPKFVAIEDAGAEIQRKSHEAIFDRDVLVGEDVADLGAAHLGVVQERSEFIKAMRRRAFVGEVTLIGEGGAQGCGLNVEASEKGGEGQQQGAQVAERSSLCQREGRDGFHVEGSADRRSFVWAVVVVASEPCNGSIEHTFSPPHNRPASPG